MRDETILEWISPEHHFDRKKSDWYWILGFIALGAAVLSFYFGNFLFGVFILLAAGTVGMLSYKETRSVSVRVTLRGIVFDKYLHPWNSYEGFWIEDEHAHGPRILLDPKNNFLPLASIPIGEDVILEELRDVMLEFLDEEYLRESIIHRWFDQLLAKW